MKSSIKRINYILVKRSQEHNDETAHKLALAYAWKRTPQAAINLMCAKCMFYIDVKERIASCEHEGCPLWSLRPFGDHHGEV